MEKKRSRFLRTSMLACVAMGGLLFAQQTASADLITRDINVILDAANVETFDLDLNQDGINDFVLTAAFVPDPFLTVGFSTIDNDNFGSNNGFVIDSVTGDGYPTVSNLALGDTVNPGDTYSFGSFDQGNLYTFFPFDMPPESGNFGGMTGYIGVRVVDINGDLTYGFVQISVGAIPDAQNPSDLSGVDPAAGKGPFDITILSVGYNSVVNQGVTIAAAPVAGAVPEPATASLALLGAAGLGMAARRRRKA